MRTVKEWIATSDDAKIPDRVKLRIWRREDGRCYLTGRQIRPGDKYQWEHRIALCNGGEHREANIFLALTEPHKVKTKADRKIKKRGDRAAKRHIGIKSSHPIPGSRGSGIRKPMNGPAYRDPNW